MKTVGDIDIHTSPLATISLAPLADFTDAPFRRMCVEGGADATYTEMVSAAALYHGHAATRFLLETLPGEPAPVCQLFGSKEEELAFAVREIERLHPGVFPLAISMPDALCKRSRAPAPARPLRPTLQRSTVSSSP